MLKVYIYRKLDSVFVKEDVGSEGHVMNDLASDMDFTLTSPPDYDHVWRWIDDKWIADNTAE